MPLTLTPDKIETARAVEAFDGVDENSVNTIRALAMDAVQRANSGHPGLPMGMADAAYVLWTRVLKHNPRNPAWFNRDRFVLSAGHGSMLLYSLLHLSGYDLSLDELKRFRQLGSKTPGHPEVGLTAGVETTTGPLGQGLSNAVGMAIAEKFLATRFNRPLFEIVDHFTYALVSDGDLMEGISHEAASLAGHLGLGKLIWLYDSNGISIDGPTSLAYSEDTAARFGAYGWHVQSADGHDKPAMLTALENARADANAARPSIIIARTHIGYGSPKKQDTNKAHGEPLGEDEVRAAKINLKLDPDAQFAVPKTVRARFALSADKGAQAEAAWRALFDEYARAFPDLAREFSDAIAGRIANNWSVPTFPLDKPLATRAASGAALNALAEKIPTLLGGSADLTPSNNTQTKNSQPITRANFSGRYIHFGVREHAMGALLNGMALHGGVVPYGGTFLIFSDYMRPAIRLAALMHQRVVFVFTHDSIGLGEDGPTHQPIEHLTALRAIPNLVVIRPADATETPEAWRVALARQNGPTALVLTRQALPVLDRSQFARAENLARGGYVLSDFAISPVYFVRVVLIATGSEVHLALEAQKALAKLDIAACVVNMPSWELFDQQSPEYRESVLPESIHARVAIEAGSKLAWSRYVGEHGAVVGLDSFGASAPYQEAYQFFGITVDAIVQAALRICEPINDVEALWHSA
ncbi:MAG: transketolase [Chloroflexi bacterium]|nr:transketolase [Chloroflexota bacterium]